MNRLMHHILTISLVVPGFAAASAAAEDRELVPLLPKDANTLVVLRILELTHSARGAKEGWAEQHETEFLAGSANIPPWVELFVRASREHPGAGGPDWTAILIPLPEGYQMSDLARREGTEVQQISDHDAVWSPQYNGYFVDLTPRGDDPVRMLGGLMPATRQDVARWLQESHRGLGTLGMSDYLTSAANETSAQIMLAIDLEDMLDPVLIRYRINGATALQDRPEAKAALIILYQTLRGAILTVQVDETVQAELSIDFGRKVGDEGQYVKPLLIELLNDLGAAIDELDDAAVEVNERTVTMRMPLSDESLRRVLSLASAPPPPPGPTPPAATPATPPSPATEAGVDLAASRRYFATVNRNVDDLGRAHSRARNYARTAQWHQNFADRIDHLPTTGVDPELLEYGRSMSTRLRALAASLHGVAVRVNALERSIAYRVDSVQYDPGTGSWGYAPGWPAWVGSGWWGSQWYGRSPPAGVTTNLQDVRARQAEVVAASAPERDKIWQMVNEERAALQRKMVARYGEAFAR